MPERIAKINSLIQQTMGEIIAREANLKPGIFVTVSKVDTTADLRYTRIFLSIFPEEETRYALATLEHELYHIQQMLNKKLNSKILPRIQFKVDTSESRADEIEKIIQEINDEPPTKK